MESSSDQELFEIFLAALTDSPYAKLVFSVNGDGSPKRQSQIAWEMQILEEQGYVPVVASPAFHLEEFIAFCPKTGLTAYFNKNSFSDL